MRNVDKIQIHPLCVKNYVVFHWNHINTLVWWLNRSGRKFHAKKFTDLAIFITLYPKWMGKEQLLQLKIRFYIKGRSLLGKEQVAPHREVCHKYGKIKYLIVCMSINELLKLKQVTNASKTLFAKVTLQQLI